MSPAPSVQPVGKSKSTGPRTPQGKQKSSLNALRHGLTGRVVVMPGEDMAAYQAFSEELFTSLAPETSVERQFAQTFVDTQWRLNRIRAIEDGMLALGHFEAAGQIEVNHAEAHAALTAAQVFRLESKAFVNLSLYEQRLQRTLKESLRQLQALQTDRAANRQSALEAVVAMRESHKMDGEPAADASLNDRPAGFVFSDAEIEAESRRQLRLAEVGNSRSGGHNLKRRAA